MVNFHQYVKFSEIKIHIQIPTSKNLLNCQTQIQLKNFSEKIK